MKGNSCRNSAAIDENGQNAQIENGPQNTVRDSEQMQSVTHVTESEARAESNAVVALNIATRLASLDAETLAKILELLDGAH